MRGGYKITYGYLPFGQRVAPCRSLASGDRAFVAPYAPMHRRALRSMLSEIPRTGHQNEAPQMRCFVLVKHTVIKSNSCCSKK